MLDQLAKGWGILHCTIGYSAIPYLCKSKTHNFGLQAPKWYGYLWLCWKTQKRHLHSQRVVS